MEKLVYENLFDQFVSMFPNNDIIEEIEKKSDVDRDDGMHIIFGLVVVPFICKLLERKDDKNLQKVFDFFELMAKSDDSKIAEVLEFTILEDLVSRGKEFLSKCKRYMGIETLQSCAAVEKYML